MSWWAVGATVGSAVLNASAAQSKAESTAGSARYNAVIAQQNAVVAEQQGAQAADMQAINARRKIGSMVASYGASGIDGGSGSAMDVLADSVRMAALDNLTIRYNYKLKALGYSNQAALGESGASNAEAQGNLEATGALAKGFGSAIPSFGGSSGGGSDPIGDFYQRGSSGAGD